MATTTALAKSTFAKKIVEFVTKEDLSGLTLKDMVEFDKWLKIKILEHTRLTSKDFKIKMN
ncbi:MAG: hypothetical protein MUP53_06450 [Bacteroidales bacterium]|nr:hypothetical protein [Bacteroidales bacterium]